MKKRGLSDKKVIFILVFAIALISFASAAHPTYPAFSESESLFFSNNEIIVLDDIVYNTGYYSVNGGAWQQFTLQGQEYGGGHPFLLERGAVDYPSALGADGTHYVIIFSCTLVNNDWDCHENKWQLRILNHNNNNNNNQNTDPITKATSICTSCDNGGCSCTGDEYCSSEGVCLLTVPGNTYFVAPSNRGGSDSNSGSYNSPWGTWGHAFERLSAGDILYMRGGEWKPRSHQRSVNVVYSDISGTTNNPIRIFNYPGEVPILNGEDITPIMYNTGLKLRNSKNLHLKGFTVKNIMQMPSSSDQQPSIGIQCSACEGIVYENIVIDNVEGRGIEHYDWWDRSGKDVSYFINVDVSNCFTPYESKPGNAADAIIAGGDVGDEFYFEGCRTWNFADDGLNGGGDGVFFHVKNSWSMAGDKYFGLSSAWEIEGHPFKFGGIYNPSVPGYSLGGKPFVIVENSIGVNSPGRGLQNNNNLRSREMPNNALIHNNLLYQVGWGNRGSVSYYEDTGGSGYSSTSTYNNNIELKGTSSQQEVRIKEASHSHNSWDSGVSATEADFVSLNYMELFTTPRKPDGSLPDVDFGKLVQGSDLRGAGLDGNDMGPIWSDY